MLTRLALLACCCLISLAPACKGDPPPPILNPALVIALNLDSDLPVTLNPGQIHQFRAFAILANTLGLTEVTQQVTWVSTDQAVAQVNTDGTLFANNPGFTTIRAEVENVASGSVFVRVLGPDDDVTGPIVMTTLQIQFEEGGAPSGILRLTKDETLDFQAVGTFSDGSVAPQSGAVWKLSDPTVATISAGGELTPIKTGIVSVNARVGTFESSYIVIQIIDPPAV